MSTLTAPIRCTSLPLWRIFTCLLLAGLFLYNPFLTAYPSAGNSAVCHPASYRATVGSSELEQFAQPIANPAEALPVRNSVQVLILQSADPDAESRRYIEPEVVLTPQTDVKQGQTLAVLEVPELAAQLSGADASVRRAQQEIRREQGDVQRAESAHSAAHSMYPRLKQASEQQKGLVAQQEVDDAQARDSTTSAWVPWLNSARRNCRKPRPTSPTPTPNISIA